MSPFSQFSVRIATFSSSVDELAMFPMADFVSFGYERATLMMDTLIWYHNGEILMLTWWLLIILVVGWGGGWAADMR